MDNKSFLLKHLEAILAIVSILAAGFFWIHTVDGLPDRVTTLPKTFRRIYVSRPTLQYPYISRQ